MEKDELQLISPTMAAEALRRLADRLETGEYRVRVMDHQQWSGQEGEWLTVKWVRKGKV